MDENNITQITEKGIEYVDEDGESKFIEFATCHEQYLKMWSDADRIAQVKKVNNMDDERIENFLKRIRQIKEVGRRNPLQPPWADGPYIEFYAEPHVRFQFANHDQYSKILRVLGEAGWRTFDLG